MNIKTDGLNNETNLFVKLAKHAIGLDRRNPYKRYGKYFYKPYRNYYNASAADCEHWEQLELAGYAESGQENSYGGKMFYMTRSGLDWLGNRLNITIHNEDD